MKRGLILFAALLAFASCGNNNSKSKTATKGSETTCCQSSCEDQSNCDKVCDTPCESQSIVEVLYMHGKQRCATCVAIGQQATALIEELGDDNIVMRSIDFSTAEGEKVADRYQIASSSIIVVKGDKVENLTTVGFQYARNNPEQFKAQLKATIQKLME